MNKLNLKRIIPFIPLLAVFVLLLIKPYYLIPTFGDTDYHLMRALEILQDPIGGLFWDYLIYPPNGRAVWHPPLFHTFYAIFWYLGGLRFAHSILCVFQILFTVFVASWVAKEEYGYLSGFFAGILSLAGNRIDIYTIPVPVAYIPIMAVLTIHYMPKEKFKAFLTSLVGVWTHIFGLSIFVFLFMADGLKNKTNLKMVLLLSPSILFWTVYWFLFRDQLGTSTEIASPTFYFGQNSIGIIILLILGIIGMHYLYHCDKKRFKLYLSYFLIICISTVILFGDSARLLQALSLPLAILSSLTIKKIYDYTIKNHQKSFAYLTLTLLIIISVIGSSPFFLAINSDKTTWNYVNIPFDYEYRSLNKYITENTSNDEILWATSSIAEKISWMTGRQVCNSNHGRMNNKTNLYQRINIYVSNNTFLIKDYNNNTIKEIPRY